MAAKPMDLIRGLARARFARASVDRPLDKEANLVLRLMQRECVGETGRKKASQKRAHTTRVAKLLRGIQFPYAGQFHDTIRDLLQVIKMNDLRQYIVEFFAGECVTEDLLLQARYQALMDKWG